MDLTTYQFTAFSTALPSAKTVSYMTLGLAGEAGEIANKVKKLIRDEDTPERREAIAAELGDVLWYVAGLATVLGHDLSKLAQANLDKLAARAAKKTLQGSGDDR